MRSSVIITEWATISTEPLGKQCPDGKMGLGGRISNTVGRNQGEVCEALAVGTKLKGGG